MERANCCASSRLSYVESLALCGLASKLIDQMYLDEDTPRAKATGEGEEDENKV
jgi:hypothetical protein